MNRRRLGSLVLVLMLLGLMLAKAPLPVAADPVLDGVYDPSEGWTLLLTDSTVEMGTEPPLKVYTSYDTSNIYIALESTGSYGPGATAFLLDDGDSRWGEYWSTGSPCYDPSSADKVAYIRTGKSYLEDRTSTQIPGSAVAGVGGMFVEVQIPMTYWSSGGWQYDVWANGLIDNRNTGWGTTDWCDVDTPAEWLSYPAPPFTVWVDDDYGLSTPGWGIDHFDKLQDGINAVRASGAVYVADGTYTEDITVSKSVSIYGSGTGSSPCALIVPATDQAYDPISDTGVTVVDVQADDVTICGVKVDGTMIAGLGYAKRAKAGIHASGVSGLAVTNCKIIECVSAVSYVNSTGGDFECNVVGDFGYDLDHGGGVYLSVAATGDIRDSTISDGQSPGVAYTMGASGEIIGNTVSNCSPGIVVSGNTAPTKVCFNTISGAGSRGAIETVGVQAAADICCNEISGDSDGIIVRGGSSHAQHIFDNYLSGAGARSGILITTDVAASGFEDSLGVAADGNVVANYGVGLQVGSSVVTRTVSAVFSSNAVTGNTTDATNNDPSSTLDARNNWWGSATGPGSMGSNVSYDPWSEALVNMSAWRSEIYIGQEITLDVCLTAEEVYGFQFLMHFDPDNLQVVDEGWDDHWFSPDLKPAAWDIGVDNVAGTVKVAASQRYDLHPSPVTGTEERVLWLTFHCTAQSLDHITLTDLILGNIEGEAIPAAWTSACIKNIGPRLGSITGTVDIQGRANESGAWAVALPGAYSDDTDATGVYTITNVVSGTYTVDIEMALYLDASRSGVLVPSGGTANLTSVELLGGDANDDDTVNIQDLSIIGGEFDNAPPGDWRADINADGVVNIQDLTICGGNYDKSSPVPWP